MRMLPLIAALSYLLGSIPFGYLLVRIFRGEDVRQSGSGNIGATNVSRKSPVLGAVTLLLDALKGSAAVALAIAFSRSDILGWNESNLPLQPDHPWSPMPSVVIIRAAVAALSAVVGHMFPVWLRFRGGKGVATALGAFALIAPQAVLVASGIFIVTVLAFRYVSLGSIVAVAFFPLLVFVMRAYENVLLALVCMAITSLLIVVKHHENIRRLIAGTENRIGAKRA
ncbi:MAG TPA: glycerol-3-phosphate 1-O-acyltransferase PlsY [Candidatus Acidoferrum sp.]|jgi:glycerol-3-phosphate acyltransferase PlsY|nr:glycerol-3-phosphate 1-O-acyltransferase PlsY [Candidatus Acidoferrum sp.]